MSETQSATEAYLTDAGYAVGPLATSQGEVTTFENDSVLGFVLHFPDAGSLIENWRGASDRVLRTAQFALRRAEAKAWNAYFVYLADAPGDYGQNIALGAIEEDLVGTRKIARAGISSTDDLKAALLPLLPVQNAPRLEAVDMATEIRLRTSELPTELIDAFLAGAAEATLTHLLESGQ